MKAMGQNTQVSEVRGVGSDWRTMPEEFADEREFLQAESSPALPGSRVNFQIPWRTPWLYLSFLLLFWLLLF
jgi:hypothetical protein